MFVHILRIIKQIKVDFNGYLHKIDTVRLFFHKQQQHSECTEQGGAGRSTTQTRRPGRGRSQTRTKVGERTRGEAGGDRSAGGAMDRGIARQTHKSMRDKTDRRSEVKISAHRTTKQSLHSEISSMRTSDDIMIKPILLESLSVELPHQCH